MVVFGLVGAFFEGSHEVPTIEFPWDPTLTEVLVLLAACFCLLATFIACVWLELEFESVRLWIRSRPAERYPTAAGSYRFTPVAGVDGVEWVRDDGTSGGVADTDLEPLRVDALLWEHADALDDETYALLLDRIHRALPADLIVVWQRDGLVLWCSRTAIAYGISPGPGGFGARLRPPAQESICGLVSAKRPFLAYHAPMLGPDGLGRMLMTHRARFRRADIELVVTRAYRAEELAERVLGLAGA